jgi:hypothetical protein
MKRHVGSMLVLASVLVMVVSSTAYSEMKISAGFKGGLNIALPGGDDLSGQFDDLDWIEVDWDTSEVSLIQLNSASITDLGSMTAFSFGGFVNLQFTEEFSIQPELLYIRKGGKQDLEVGTTIGGSLPLDFSGELKWKLDYLEIPVLLKYTVPTEGSFAPSFFAGPAIGFLATSNLGVGIMGFSEDVDIGFLTAGVDFGVVVGAGFNIDLGPTKFITVDGRYSLGFADWTDEPLIDVVELKNSGVEIMAGMGFRFGGGE